MKTKSETRQSLLHLTQLPAFAEYLLTHRLQDFVLEQLKLLRELDVPLLQAFKDYSEEQLIKFATETNTEYLSYLAKNKAREQIEESIKKWVTNQLPKIDKYGIVAEDITLITYMRKKLFLHFIPEYCRDAEQMIELIKELDLFLMESETASTNTYIQLLKDRINEHSNYIEAINEQLQRREEELLEAQEIAEMGSFEWDISSKNTHVTKQLLKIFEMDDLTNMDDFMTRVHPADKQKLQDAIAEGFKTGIYECEYRYMGNQKQKVIWSRGVVSYQEGKPVKVTGTILDVTERHNILEELQRSEQRYKQAEALTHIGNYQWDLSTNEIKWSDELYHIYGLDPKKDQITNAAILTFIHPEDIPIISKETQEAIQSLKPFDYYYRIKTPDAGQKILHARGEVITDEEKKSSKVIGTVQDVTEKQNLIRQLRQSEALYKQAQAISHIGNWTYYPDKEEFEWSDEMYRIYEVPLGQKITLDVFLSSIHPDDRNVVKEAIKTSTKTKSHYEKNHRLLFPDGRIKVIHRRGEVTSDEAGNVKMIGTAQDITEEKRVEQELLEKQTFIKKIADATPSIIASYNINTGKYTFISEGLKKLLGYNTKEVAEKGIKFFLDVIHPDDVSGIMEKNAKALEKANADPLNESIEEFIYRMRHQNGEYRWFHTYGTIFDRNGNGKVEHVLNISLDITTQIEATQKIQEQEHFIQQIADASPTILYLFDVPSQAIVYINREIFFVLGYTVEEILEAGSSITQQLYHPEDLNLLPDRKGSSKIFHHRDSMMQYECRMRGSNDEWRWVLVREVVFKSDDDGNVLQILGAALDINKRKEMEKTLLQNSFQLQQSNASLEEFAYVASHDLKEPLRKISTFGDRLLNTQLHNLTEDGKIYLRKIVDASHRMQTMISDLLSISMISGDKSFTDHSLQAVLEDVLQALEFKIEQKNAIITSEPMPNANIIPSQFRQLFQNILSNSLKFVRDDVQPHITIKHTYVPADEMVHLHVNKSNMYHKLEFIDNG
ncbi:MAG: PAS domain-containing protein, partial [Chitinophagaceae bacterium]|nr:PAS domain-containing protein [Chitinophagaceae bacterium]